MKEKLDLLIGQQAAILLPIKGGVTITMAGDLRAVQGGGYRVAGFGGAISFQADDVEEVQRGGSGTIICFLK